MKAVNPNRRKKVDSLFARCLRRVLPPYCLLCGAPGANQRDICRGCASDLHVNTPCCPRCALSLETGAPLCGVCLKHEPPFAMALAPFDYAAPLDQLITRLKFGRDLAAGRVLAALFVDYVEKTAPVLPQAVLPVPLHLSRLRERGYNQTLELAKPITHALGVPLCVDSLQRERNTLAQTGLDAKARRRNLRGAFVVNEHNRLPEHIAILDDVMTTGATLRECARMLRQAGVKRVDVWAIARVKEPG